MRLAVRERKWHPVGLGPEDVHDEALQDEGKADGEDHLSEQRRALSLRRGEDAEIEQHRRHGSDEERQGKGEQERLAAREQRERREGAHGRHVAVGEVQDPGGFVDEHQAERDQGIQASRGQPRDRVLEEAIHGYLNGHLST